MFKTIELENYRGFKEIQLTQLKRINVITGVNGAGKSSILESLFLICGAANASLALSVAGFRGDVVLSPGQPNFFRSMFKDLDTKLIPKISAYSSNTIKSNKFSRVLEIRPIYSIISKLAATSQEQKLTGIEFNFTGKSGNEKNKFGWQTSVPAELKKQIPHGVDSDDIRIMLGGVAPKNKDLMNAQYVSPYVRQITEQNYMALTEMTKERRIDEVVSALKIIHPAIENIVPLAEGESKEVYVDVGQKDLLPISLLGSGVSNVLHIVLPLLRLKKSIVLIDEFEDGIHHSIFIPLLKLVFDLSKKNENQVYLTTHSEEFLKAIIFSAEESGEDDISFYRLSRRSIVGVVPNFSLSDVSDLLDARMEIR